MFSIRAALPDTFEAASNASEAMAVSPSHYLLPRSACRDNILLFDQRRCNVVGTARWFERGVLVWRCFLPSESEGDAHEEVGLNEW